ncbi:MAG: DHH family phosphoesterase [Patescibacteria group bacterium]
MNYPDVAKQVKTALDGAKRIVVMQAGNPDGDSLSSALALETLLGQMGKDVVLYCAIDMPTHLRYLDGWDRVQKDFPSQFDLAFVVDCGYWRLFGQFEKDYGRGRLPKDKLIIINEHDLEQDMECAINVQDIQAVSSGQIIFELFTALDSKIDKSAATFIASSIMADTLGFTSEVVVDKPRVFEVMAELVRAGLNLGELQDKRFEQMKISADTLKYRGELLGRVEYFGEGRIASITIPYDEIRDHSQEFNPTVILDETRLVTGVAVAIGFKQYVKNGSLVRVTGRIRCNHGFSIADELAKTFPDGGGHVYAAGFKVEGTDLDFEDIKQKIITRAVELLDSK